MTGEGFDIRIYCIRSDGTLEPLMGADVRYFHGAVLNVGDTLAKWGLDDVYRFYSVQRRYFVNSIENDHGWCVIVREIDTAPQMEAVVKEWSEETRFWRDVAEQEHIKEQGDLARTPGTIEHSVRQREEQAKHRPHHGLLGPEMRVLRFMAAHPRIKTIDQIPEAGERRMKRLHDKGLVKSVEKTERGFQKWSITAEARAELRRIDTWKNWNLVSDIEDK